MIQLWILIVTDCLIFRSFSLKTSPLNEDTDGDGLSDFVEVNTHSSNPLVEDTDEDGFSDMDEVLVPEIVPLADQIIRVLLSLVSGFRLSVGRVWGKPVSLRD